jgi:hypothetical protein
MHKKLRATREYLWRIAWIIRHCEGLAEKLSKGEPFSEKDRDIMFAKHGGAKNFWFPEFSDARCLDAYLSYLRNDLFNFIDNSKAMSQFSEWGEDFYERNPCFTDEDLKI